MKTTAYYIGTMMKTVVVILAILGFVSCEKNKDSPGPPQTSVTEPAGYWKGHYTISGSVGQYSVEVLVKADGTARIYYMGEKTDTAAALSQSKFSGTWTLSAETLDVQFQDDGELRLFTGTINPAEKTWIGTWFKGAVFKGTIKMAR